MLVSMDRTLPEWVQSIQRKANRIVEDFDPSRFGEDIQRLFLQLQHAMESLEGFQKELIQKINELEHMRELERRPRFLYWIYHNLEEVRKADEIEELRRVVGQIVQEIENLFPQLTGARQEFTVSGTDGGGFTAGEIQKDGYQLRISKDALPPDMPDTNVSMSYYLTNPRKKPLPAWRS